MGIRFQCPDCGAKLNVKSELAGKRGVCPKCHAKIQIPAESVDAGPADAPTSAPIAPEPLPQIRTQPAPTPVSTAPAPTPAPTAPVQPTAAAAASRWFVRPPSGGQFGPAAEAVLRQWIGEGRITPDTLVWREGDPEWLKASAAFPELTAAPTPPSTPLVTGGTVPISVGVTLPKPTELPTPSSELDAASAATAMLMARRKRARSTGLLIMGILVVAVLILLPILVYVLMFQGAPPPPPADKTAWRLPAMVAEASAPA